MSKLNMNIVLWLTIGMLTTLLGCSSNNTELSPMVQGPMKLSGTPAPVSNQAAPVFGFEDASKWSIVNSTNSAHTEGNVSGEVNVTGWMQITSIPLSSIAAQGVEIGEAASIDIRLPQSVNWGEVRLIVDLPSMGIWWRDLGGVRFADITPGAFAEVDFTFPADVSAALNGDYSDLRVIVVVNGPSMSGPILLDNLRFEGTQVSVDTEVVATPFEFRLPKSVPLESVVVQANESLRLADAVHAANSLANVVNMGSSLTEIGVDAQIDGSVFAKGNVILQDRAQIHGFVRAEGTITEKSNVVADGGTAPNSGVTVGATYRWNVNWPVVNGVHMVEPEQTLDLAPGNYASVTVSSRGTLNLYAGTYYFDNFTAHAQANINIEGNGSPVFVYARDSITCRAALHHSQSSADFFVGFSGTQIVDLDGPFAGTVVAPNATIRLAPLNGGSHEGTFFAKNVLAEARTPINKVPFAHWHALLVPETGTVAEKVAPTLTIDWLDGSELVEDVTSGNLILQNHTTKDLHFDLTMVGIGGLGQMGHEFLGSYHLPPTGLEKVEILASQLPIQVDNGVVHVIYVISDSSTKQVYKYIDNGYYKFSGGNTFSYFSLSALKTEFGGILGTNEELVNCDSRLAIYTRSGILVGCTVSEKI